MGKGVEDGVAVPGEGVGRISVGAPQAKDPLGQRALPFESVKVLAQVPSLKRQSPEPLVQVGQRH
jgi:hypothetical protein